MKPLRMLCVVGAVSVLVSACAGQPAGTVPTLDPRPLAAPSIRGVAYHGMWTSRTATDRAEILDRVAEAGIQWVRLDIAWSRLQPVGPDSFDERAVNDVDQRLREIEERGLSVLVMLWWAPPWSSGTADQSGVPGNPEDYARTAAWMVHRWGDRIDALEVWNEPDLPEFFASTSAAEYATLLKATYPMVKAVRPGLPVVSAAAASLNPQWYADFFDNDVIGSYDALGAHPYPTVADVPPYLCEKAPDTGCNLRWLSSYAATRGDDDHAIWVTEFGYSTHGQQAVPGWQRGVTEGEQARYTAAMLAYFGSLPRVEAAFVYRDRDFPDSDGQDHQNSFGILRADGSTKPVYDVLTCSPAAECAGLAGEAFTGRHR